MSRFNINVNGAVRAENGSRLFLWIGFYIIIDITLNAEVGSDVKRPLWFIHHEWDRYWETGLDQEQNNGRQ